MGSNDAYFELCSFKERGVELTGQLEDHIEAVSAADGPGGREAFLDHWADGVYRCARCKQPLYSSVSKWHGPCAWPSFRQAVSDTALEVRRVENYNSYTCEVAEVYCSGCKLFIGHKFEDAREKGDTAAECTGWRH